MMSRVVGLKALTYTRCRMFSLPRISPYYCMPPCVPPVLPLFPCITPCPCVYRLFGHPLFLDRGTVLRTGENRGKGIGVITLFTH